MMTTKVPSASSTQGDENHPAGFPSEELSYKSSENSRIKLPARRTLPSKMQRVLPLNSTQSISGWIAGNTPDCVFEALEVKHWHRQRERTIKRF